MFIDGFVRYIVIGNGIVVVRIVVVVVVVVVVGSGVGFLNTTNLLWKFLSTSL